MIQGFAPKQLMQESLPKLKKKVHMISEEMMKVLELLDGLTFTETQKEARAKRKCLVDKIHVLHTQCDVLLSSVEELKAQMK